MMPAAPARPAKSTTSPSASNLPAGRRRQLAAVHRDLRAVHDDWKAAMAQHNVRIEGQFKALARRLEPGPGTDPADIPTPKHIERIAAALEGVRLKPKKGRGKDLRHVERVLQRVLKVLPDGE